MRKALLFLLLPCLYASCAGDQTKEVVSLNGRWEIAAAPLDAPVPSSFTHTAPVPGFADMASPRLIDPNRQVKDTLFWYRRTFEAGHTAFDIAELNIRKASYGTRVYVNGRPAGTNPYNFTAGKFDIKELLNPEGENEIIVGVGCFNNVPDSIINGLDSEQYIYPAGIWDDVFIKLGNYPYITNIQHAPDIEREEVRVIASIRTEDGAPPQDVNYRITEAVGGKTVAEGRADQAVVRNEQG